MSSKGIGHDGFKSKVIGKLIPIRDHILLTDMEFGERKIGMFVLPSDDGKSEGVRHRWARVWAVGPEQKDIKVGEWVLLEHGRWTRGITVEENGEDIIVRRADNKAILLISDERPDENTLNTFGGHSKVEHQQWDPASFASPSFEQ
jgi:co-chaperonin GroES (HSP10)